MIDLVASVVRLTAAAPDRQVLKTGTTVGRRGSPRSRSEALIFLKPRNTRRTGASYFGAPASPPEFSHVRRNRSRLEKAENHTQPGRAQHLNRELTTNVDLLHAATAEWEAAASRLTEVEKP